LFMNHHESLLTWNTAPAALGLTLPIPLSIKGYDLRLIPQVKFLAHIGGGFDTHGLAKGDPNQAYFLTDDDTAESDQPDIATVIDQFTPNHNLHSTFVRLTIHFSVDAEFTLSKILDEDSDVKAFLDKIGLDLSFGLGFTLGGDIIWKPDD